jgi:hypothetical protein
MIVEFWGILGNFRNVLNWLCINSFKNVFDQLYTRR